jgi:hypothetical protein
VSPRAAAGYQFKLRGLRVLRAAGYQFMLDHVTLPPLLELTSLTTLDLCGCVRLQDDSMAEWLPSSLVNLNVRGTRFGDAAASSLAARGANLARLNASGTLLTGAGLDALSRASDQLCVLDLCYAKGCYALATLHAVVCSTLPDEPVTNPEASLSPTPPAPRLAQVERHRPRLEMLGLGGNPEVGLDGLRRMLHGGAVVRLGIGGCPRLNASETFDALPMLCPGLASLNAHKLCGLTAESLGQLLVATEASLRSLDISDCELESVAKLGRRVSWGRRPRRT